MEEKKKILVVEDDKLNQLAYKGVLSKEYNVTICGDNTEFYISLNRITYDLFIIDLALNCEKNGIDLIMELRQMKEYERTPIIVVTAWTLKKDEKISLDAGADKFITKPFVNKTLLEEIGKCF